MRSTFTLPPFTSRLMENKHSFRFVGPSFDWIYYWIKLWVQKVKHFSVQRQTLRTQYAIQRNQANRLKIGKIRVQLNWAIALNSTDVWNKCYIDTCHTSNDYLKEHDTLSFFAWIKSFCGWTDYKKIESRLKKPPHMRNSSMFWYYDTKLYVQADGVAL